MLWLGLVVYAIFLATKQDPSYIVFAVGSVIVCAIWYARDEILKELRK